MKVTEFLNDTEHAGFATWVRERKQKGFRDFDRDRQASWNRPPPHISHGPGTQTRPPPWQGTFDLDELTAACEAYLDHLATAPRGVRTRDGAASVMQRRASPASELPGPRPGSVASVRGSSAAGDPWDRLGPDLSDTGGA